MRIIGYIDHPRMKITVFKMDLRITVKFEVGFYEQAYKFRVSDTLNGLEAVQAMVDAAFIEEVEERFEAMRGSVESLMKRFIPASNVAMDEEII